MRIKIIFIAVVAIPFLVLGGLNIYKRISWSEPTDGAVWEERSEGLTAIKVEDESPAYLSGIKKGDILYSLTITNLGYSIQPKSKIDVAKTFWIAGGANQKVLYQINRGGDLYFPSLFLETKGTNIIYYFLVLIGFMSLILGIIVFLNTRRAFAFPYLFFFTVTLTLYSLYVFSATGNLDTLDSIFYWMDKIALLVFPPLLLHFYVFFPKRKRHQRKRLSTLYFLYVPSIILFLANVFIHLPNFLKLTEPFILLYYQMLEKLALLHFSFFSLIAFALVLKDSLQTTNQIVKNQLKWILYGLGLGILPSTFLYTIPFVIGQVPSTVAIVSIIFQALIPLTLAYSISRYKLVDLEVILKKAITLIFSYVVIIVLYFIVSSQTRIFSENILTAFVLGLLAIGLGATLFSPLKKLIQTVLDRVMYKRSYQYRRILLSISQEVSRERNLQRLTQSLLEMTANALSLKNIALLLPVQNKKNTFFILRSQGDMPSSRSHILFEDEIYEQLKNKSYLSLYTSPEKREFRTKARELINLGFYHFLPLKVEDNLIGCLGMGKKINNTYLTSEDWELLRTISSPVALALENAYLFNQASIKALELERMKDYSENIIESLTVGVVVIDIKGLVVGWNRVLEETLSLKKNDVLEKKLIDVLGQKNFSAVFPSDTQKDYRLMSEITIEMPIGDKKIFDIAKTPLLDKEGHSSGTIIVFEDITEKFSLQQQLLTSEKLASIGLLSAGVAHEINTPLTGISSYVQILQKELPDSKNSQILEKIEAQTERVAKIVKNLLNFARNPSETAFHNVNLKESLEDIIALIDYKLKNLNIQLDLNLNPVSAIWAQGERLQQVFINIILNAIDAMPKGGTLSIGLLQSENQIEVKIKDTGTGIKEQHLSHIFDPFFTTKGIGKGTGLGLSISYAIIKEHEGHIRVKSEFKQGTLFTINIPADLSKNRNRDHETTRQ